MEWSLSTLVKKYGQIIKVDLKSSALGSILWSSDLVQTIGFKTYVCIYVCVCVCIHTDVYMYVCIHIYRWALDRGTYLSFVCKPMSLSWPVILCFPPFHDRVLEQFCKGAVVLTCAHAGNAGLLPLNIWCSYSLCEICFSVRSSNGLK